MTTRLTVPPAVEPITLAALKLRCRVDHDADDSILTGHIVTAREECEKLTQRALITQTHVQTLDRFSDAFRIDWPRLQSVTSIKYDDVDGAEQTLDPASYIVDTASEPGYVVPAVLTEWPNVIDRINAIRVTYICGYGDAAADVPQSLRDWILCYAEQLYMRCIDFSKLPRVDRYVVLSY
jgi:uncharacterized phiE125 gp8 family phage protein